MIKYNRYRIEVTPSGGTVTWVTPKLVGDFVSLYVKPTTASTKYTFRLEDPDGIEIWESPSQRPGPITRVMGSDVFNEIVTCKITGSTKDESFVVIIKTRADMQNR